MIGKRNRGFGAYEMLTVCVMLLIIVVVALAYVFKTDYTEMYRIMRYNARMFATSTNNLFLENDTQSVYYLKMLEDQKLYSSIKNPFQGEKYCDSYASKVEKKDNTKIVTLECGNYLIYQQDFLKTPYVIYQVSDWSSKKHSDDNQTVVFYNYQEDGKEVFDKDLEQDIFLYEFNKLYGTSYGSIEQIPQQDAVVEKTMYRYMKKVSD